jgi:hypothetical protein
LSNLARRWRLGIGGPADIEEELPHLAPDEGLYLHLIEIARLG